MSSSRHAGLSWFKVFVKTLHTSKAAQGFEPVEDAVVTLLTSLRLRVLPRFSPSALSRHCCLSELTLSQTREPS